VSQHQPVWKGHEPFYLNATPSPRTAKSLITRPSARLSPEFFALYLNSGYGRAQIARLSAGTAQQHFNVGALKKLRIPDVELNEQLSIVDNVVAVMAGARAGRAELSALATVRSALLADIFGGI